MKGRPWMVVRARSFIVRMDRSTSPTWSLAAATLSLEGRTLFRMHSNSMSARRSEMLKPLDLYIARTGLISRRRVALFLLSTGATVFGIELCERWCEKKGDLGRRKCPCKVSHHCGDKLGTCTGLKAGACWEGPLVVFPLMSATSGP